LIDLMSIGPDVVFPFFAVFLVLALVYAWRLKKKRLDVLVCVALFAIYVFFAVDYAFLPLFFDSEIVHSISPLAQVNLTPFADYDASQAVGNTMLGVPWGFGLMFVAPLSPRQVLLSGVFFALGIETGQLLLNLLYGFAYRAVDVTDVVFNLLGVVAGLGLFFVAARLYGAAFAHVDVGQHLGRIHQVFHAPDRAPNGGSVTSDASFRSFAQWVHARGRACRRLPSGQVNR
jgi:glycopeptide antibiotics resistance protein